MSKFKVGDKVVRVQAPFSSRVPSGTLGTVKRIGPNSGHLIMEEYTGSFNPNCWALQQPRKTTTRHKHAALIHAWADGAVIERYREGEWINQITPIWNGAFIYRIKPEKSEAELEKEDILKEMEALKVRLDKLEVN